MVCFLVEDIAFDCRPAGPAIFIRPTHPKPAFCIKRLLRKDLVGLFKPLAARDLFTNRLGIGCREKLSNLLAKCGELLWTVGHLTSPKRLELS